MSVPAEQDEFFRDGLGVRYLRQSGDGTEIQVLRLSRDLAATRTAVTDRVERLATLRLAQFAPVRLAATPADDSFALEVIFDHVQGVRLLDILELASTGRLTVDMDAALHIIRQVLGALAALHESRKVTHGAIGPERIVITPRGQVVILEHVLGLALERLGYPAARLWMELRIPVPQTSGSVRFDEQTDVVQVGVLALALCAGRPLGVEDYPERLSSLIDSLAWRSGQEGAAPLIGAVSDWLRAVLQVGTRRRSQTARQAQASLEGLIRKWHRTPSSNPLKALLGDYQRARGARSSRTSLGGVEPQRQAEWRVLSLPTGDDAPEAASDAPADLPRAAARKRTPSLPVDEAKPVRSRARARARVAPAPAEPVPSERSRPLAARHTTASSLDDRRPDPLQAIAEELVASEPVEETPSELSPPLAAEPAAFFTVDDGQPDPLQAVARELAAAPSPDAGPAVGRNLLAEIERADAVQAEPVRARPAVSAAPPADAERVPEVQLQAAAPPAPVVEVQPTALADDETREDRGAVPATSGAAGDDLLAATEPAGPVQPVSDWAHLEVPAVPAVDVGLARERTPDAWASVPAASGAAGRDEPATTELAEVHPAESSRARLSVAPAEVSDEPLTSEAPASAARPDAATAAAPDRAARPAAARVAEAEDLAPAAVRPVVEAAGSSAPRAVPAALRPVPADPRPRRPVAREASRAVRRGVGNAGRAVGLALVATGQATGKAGKSLGAAVLGLLGFFVVVVSAAGRASAFVVGLAVRGVLRGLVVTAQALAASVRIAAGASGRALLQLLGTTRQVVVGAGRIFVRGTALGLRGLAGGSRLLLGATAVILRGAARLALTAGASTGRLSLAVATGGARAARAVGRDVLSAVIVSAPVVGRAARALLSGAVRAVVWTATATLAVVAVAFRAARKLGAGSADLAGRGVYLGSDVADRLRQVRVGRPVAVTVLVLAFTWPGVQLARAWWPWVLEQGRGGVDGSSETPEAVAPAPDTGTVTVRSEPPGAEVWLDGRLAGRAPLTIPGVRAGSRTFLLRSASGAVRSTVNVRGGQTTDVIVPIFSGWIAVFAPIDLQILDQGNPIGTSGSGRIMVAPGEHALELVSERYGFRQELKASVKPGEVTALNIDLPTTTLEIEAPEGAEILLDGQMIGTAPLGPQTVTIGTSVVAMREPGTLERQQTVVLTFNHPSRIVF